jgi:hypothetical protein
MTSALPQQPPNGERRETLRRFSECQIDTLPARQGVLAVRKRCDAVKHKPRRPAPHHDVAMVEPEPARLVAALRSAEQEDRRQAQ